MRRLFGWLGLFFLLASAFLLGASRFLPRLDETRWADSAEAVGQIVGFVQNGSRRRPLVSFVASDGDPYVFEAEAYPSGMLQGQLVTVRYFLTPDLKASLKTDFSPAQLGLGIAGCSLMALGLASLLIQMRISSLHRQLMLYGTRLTATVTSIEENRRVKFKGRHPLMITCTMHNPQGIGEWTLKSGWVWTPSPGLQVGSAVPVLVDLYHPSRHCVLAEEATPAHVESSVES